MQQIYGGVEYHADGAWCEVVDIASLLAQHVNLNGCLFGVDNYAGYIPLFADRGLPEDCSVALRTRAGSWGIRDSRASWVAWSELNRVDWDERVLERGHGADGRARDGGAGAAINRWLHDRSWLWARDALDRHPDELVPSGVRVFRRFEPRRGDCLVNTEFPLLMKMMGCLAERFGEHAVRLVVWFGAPALPRACS